MITIDAIYVLKSMKEESVNSFHTEAFNMAIEALQQEIVRCKDCKYILKCRSEESAKKFGQIYKCRHGIISVPKPNDYCSYAERKINE